MNYTPEYLILLNAIQYTNLSASQLGEVVGLIFAAEYGEHNKDEFLNKLNENI